MLLSFKIANFLSICEPQEIIFTEGFDQKSDSYGIHNISDGKYKILKTMAFYGANASGKSNLIKALQFVRKYIIQGASKIQSGDKISDNFNYKPFLLKKSSLKEPSLFEINFLVYNKDLKIYVRYQYGFLIDNNIIHKEWLLAFPSNRGQTWFTRERQNWQFNKNYGGEVNLNSVIAKQTAENVLFLSKAGGQQNHPLLKDLFLWFRDTLKIIDFSPPFQNIRFTTELAFKNPDAFKFVKNLMLKSDLGVSNLSVDYKKIAIKDLDDENEKAFYSQHFQELKEVPIIKVNLSHSAELENTFNINFEDESEGTKRIYSFAGPCFETLATGQVLIVDEFGASLHPLLAKELVNLFNSSINKNFAQLLFVTHDTHILSPGVLRRDQVWFVNKNISGATEYTSLWDYRPSKEEAIEKGYLLGRYNGIPYVDNIITAFQDDEANTNDNKNSTNKSKKKISHKKTKSRDLYNL